MSRRAGKHLEREQVVADQVVEVLDSRGPCPGRCNAAYRRRLEQMEKARGEVMLQWGGPAHPDLLDAEAGRRVTVPEPRPGRPVWCRPCVVAIEHALEQLPRLLVLTLESSVIEPTRPGGESVLLPTGVLEVAVLAGRGLTVERLGCGHRHTWRGFGPAPRTRQCRTCVAASMVPEPGRLAPAERAGRAGRREPVSPAGSPAWVEVDAAVEWVCSVAALAKYLVGSITAREYDDLVEQPLWRTAGQSAARVRAAHEACRWLLAHLADVLQLDAPIGLSLGQEAMQMLARLESVSGQKIQINRLKGECDRCGKRALVQVDASHVVTCRACNSHFTEGFLLEKARRVGAEVPR